MMQDDIYRGIGATDRPDVDDVEADPRAEARALAADLARGGTQPLRDELERDRMRSMSAKGKMKGGY